MLNQHPTIHLSHDGETITVTDLTIRSRSVHDRLTGIDPLEQATVVLDAIDIGIEVLGRAAQHGDLENLKRAIDRLDEQSMRIVTAATDQVSRTIDKTVADMAATIQGEKGPLAPLLAKFDPSTEGNLIDLFRNLVSATAAKATKQAVSELAEANHDAMERLTKTIAALEVVAAAEKARAEEAAKGTAKGIDHEHDVETLLGELVAIGGDGLDDVSTVTGSLGTKKGDKRITPKGGCAIVTEEKCTTRISETKIRTLLAEAMGNRNAKLGMLIVEDTSKVPGGQPFHFIDDDKVVVVAERYALRLVYALFRAKAIAIQRAACATDDESVDEALTTIVDYIEEIKRSLERVRLIKTEHTKISTALSQAGGYVDDISSNIAAGVAEIMKVIDGLITEPDDLAA